MSEKTKVFIAGSKGMVGSAVVRELNKFNQYELLTKSRSELDLMNLEAVKAFFGKEKIDMVVLAAAKVGGIQANINYPAQFLFENLQIQNNIIHNAYLSGVKKLVFLGSSCVFPINSPQPIKEEYLLDGKLEPTNEGYALAKISGLKMCEFYRKQYGFNAISLMPCNLYGPNDSFDLQHSHVLSALVKRFSDAKNEGIDNVVLWGSGIARREFMHVDDMACAIRYFMENYNEKDMVNIGWGEDVTIEDLANLIAIKVGYFGKISWDRTKPDGMLKKCLDVTKMKSLGFNPTILLEFGVEQMISIYNKN